MTEPKAPGEPGVSQFSLIETMRLEAGVVTRLDRHLTRLRTSARHFGYPWHDGRIRSALEEASTSHAAGTWRLRLLVDGAGAPSVTCSEYRDSTAVWRIAFANHPVDSADWRLAHKTTAREPYEVARRGRPDVDDVVLWNERGEVTESTIASIVVETEGVKSTPPLSSGLLAGVLRGQLLESGEIVERVIMRGHVARAPRVWLVNSLRGWVDATLVR